MTVSKVYRICHAYEAGVGKGRDGDAVANPYREGTDEHEAWGYGFEEGHDWFVKNRRPVTS